MLIFLRDIDRSFAEDQFTRFKKNFVDDRFGLTGIREYPMGESGAGDIDSGPVVLGFGGAATLVGMQTLSLFGDHAMSLRIRNAVEALAFPLQREHEKEYLFGALPIADAFIAWSHSGMPVQEQHVSFARFHVYSIIVFVLLSIFFWILVRDKARDSKGSKSGLLVIILVTIVASGCRSVDVNSELFWNSDIRQLIESFDNYYKKHRQWPSRQAWDSVKRSNKNFKRFVRLDYTTDYDTVRLDFKLEYEEYYNVFKTIEMKQLVQSHDTGYSSAVDFNHVNLALQGGIHLGHRVTLTPGEKRQFRKWERMRSKKSQLLIENLKTKETKTLKIGTHVNLFANTAVIRRNNFSFDDATGEDYYDPAEWIVSGLNPNDSTIDIKLSGGWIFKHKINYAEIDSLKIKHRRKLFKIVGIRDARMPEP
jgi:hypothetical protein